MRVRGFGAACGSAALALLMAGTAVTPAAAAERGERGFTFAVIGDIPYGAAQVARFPAVVDQINADPAVQLVDHLGDIKSGSSVCSDTYFAAIRTQFDRFADPLVYTPGDNEWTDCHRANNGGYNPLERLAAVRKVFFPQPGTTLGRHAVRVRSQARAGFPENVRYSRADVAFAAVHVIGSDNGLSTWTGNTEPTPEQANEVTQRIAAGIGLIEATFDQARAEKQRAVVLLMQADMFDPTVPNPSPADSSALGPIVREIAARAATFHGPVYLFNGDSHAYNVDAPLAPGSPWLDFYQVASPAPNLTRITVDGSTGVNDYLRVTVQERGRQVLTWDKVPFTAPLPA